MRTPRFGLTVALTAFVVSSCDCDDLLGKLPAPAAVLVHAEDAAPPLPLLEIALGKVDVGAPTEVTFDVRNDGNADLHVSDLAIVPDTERCPQPSGAFTLQAPVLVEQPDGPALRAFVVAKGQSQKITLRFAPTSGQAMCTVVEVRSDDEAHKALRALITGQGDAAALCADRAVVDFGEVFLGDTKEESFTLTSCGTKPVTISEVARNDQFPPFDVDPVSVPKIMQPGDALTIPARFAPTVEGAWSIGSGTSGQLTFQTDASAQAYRVDLVGAARRPPSCVMQVMPSVLNFGTVAEGRTSTQAVLVRNIGELPCTVATIAVRAPAGSFSRALVDIAEGEVLPPQTSTTVNVTFAPTAIQGVENGFLDVTSDDPLRPTLTVPLEGNSIELQPCTLEAQPSGLNFGVQTLMRSAERRVGLKNIGTETCSVTATTITAGAPEFTAVASQLPIIGTMIPVGDTVDVIVAFRPVTTGAKIGNLRVTFKEMGFSFPPAPSQTLDVPLTGDAAAPCLSVVPQDVDFGNVAVNATADAEVSIRNCGGGELSLRGLQFRAGSHPDFVLTTLPTLPQLIAPGASVEVTVRARPTTQGTTQGGSAMYGALEVLSDMPPQAVALRANAPVCAQGLQCQPTTLQFGDVDMGTDLVRSFACQNPGTQSVDISPTVAAPFEILNAPAAVAPGETAVVTVKFTPSNTTQAAQTIDVGASSCAGVALTILARGKGVNDELPVCPAPAQFSPQVVWTWTGQGAQVPASREIWMTPLVARTADTNADGAITRDDMPTVLFSTFDKNDFPGLSAASGGSQDTLSDPVPAVLRAVRGDTGASLWDVSNPEYAINSAVTPAVVDLDGDGFVEIIAQKYIVLEGVEIIPGGPKLLGKYIRGNLIAFNHDGSFRWISDEWTRSSYEMEDSAGPSVGDVDGDGFAEIAIGDTLFDRNGRFLWKGGKGTGSAGHGPGSVLVDTDGQPGLELVAGPTVYRKDGTILWDRSSDLAMGEDGLSSVADLDGDGQNEVVFRAMGESPGDNGSTHMATAVWVLDGRTGALIAGPAFPPAEMLDPATCRPGEDENGAADDKCHPIPSHTAIMDLDDDGDLDVVLANRSAAVALDGNLVELWRAMISDQSGASGPIGFDFENDGLYNPVYNDESTVYVFDENGASTYEASYISATITETATVADVDLDGHANILIGSNAAILGGGRGLQMLSNTSTSWAQTRGIWNQHAYVESLVGELGTPIYEATPVALKGFRVATPHCVP